MREQFTLDAINLKSYSISEADKLLLMYSKEKGLVRGIAKGVKKTSGKFGSARAELLSANRMMLNKGRNINTICQSEAVNTFYNLRNDINKLFYAMYCAEIAANFGKENDPDSEEIYNLLYTCFDCIAKSASKVQVMMNVLRFQLKIMNITGYSLELKICVKCRKEPGGKDIYFSAEAGGILCHECASEALKKVKMHNKIKEFLYTLLNEDFTKHTKYDDKADEKVCSVCIDLLKHYIEYYSPKRFKTSEALEICRQQVHS